jgi:hypothetical protein
MLDFMIRKIDGEPTQIAERKLKIAVDCINLLYNLINSEKSE